MDTDKAWQLWGERDPYYGVLTHPDFRACVLTANARDLFFASGRDHVEQVMAACRLHLDGGFAPQRVLDFGCGVGRLLVPFAARAREVVGIDVAPSMLIEAGRNCEAFGADNVQLVQSDDALSAVSGTFDLVHSVITLQHIGVERGMRLFRLLVERVAPGGCGALHVTFAWSRYPDNAGRRPPPVPPPPPPPLVALRRRLRDAIRPAPAPAVLAVNEGADPEMQMHAYELSDLHYLLMAAGVTQVWTELTDHGGALGAILYFRRP